MPHRDARIPKRLARDKPTIGVVVPALAAGGGVPAVAEFLCAQIERTQRFGLELFSLPTSSRDACSVRFLSPPTWRRTPCVSTGSWQGRKFKHCGVFGAELEFRRVAPSRLLRLAVEHCDLIQVVCGASAPAFALAGCGKPIVLQVATRAAVERRQSLRGGAVGLRPWRRLMTGIIDRYERHALRMVDAVMVENEWMLRHVRKVVGNGRTSVQSAPPGVDCEEFTPSALRQQRLRRDPYVLFVGRLSDPRKNLVLLCKAFAMLCAQSTFAPRLVLAGSGEMPDAARVILLRAGVLQRVERVHSPSRDELRSLYQQALCLAVPSDEEGFGMVVVESMACGAPVVATRCGGPEGIIQHGEDGLLVPLADAQGFANGIRLLCGEVENRRMGERARRTVLARFSADVSFRPFLETYDRLLP